VSKEEPEEVEAAQAQPDWSDRTILIVDDVRTNLLLLESILAPSNARILGVDNGLKAVNTVKRDRSVDFVLMDVRMPVLDGYEATRRIKRIRTWLPVIAISAYPGSAESEKWRDAGCDAFLGKPLNSNELIRTMSSLFENVPSRA
jgi:CheY-like chemotaxis protein